MPTRLLVSAIALGLLTITCTADDARSLPTPSAVIRIPALSRAGLTWLDSDNLVTAGERDPDAFPAGSTRLWRLKIETSEMTEVELGGADDCPVTFYREPVRLSDGRLGAVKECGDPNARPLIYPITIVAIDSDGTETVVADFTTLGLRTFIPITFSLARTLDRGVASVFGGVCTALVWIEDGRVQPVEVEVGEGDHRFALGEGVALDPRSSCDSTGQADYPTWSPTRDSVAFLASPASVGVKGGDRFGQPFELYVMETDQLQPRSVVQGIRSPRGLHWSPDGTQLLVTGSIDGQGMGTWTVQPDGGELHRLASTSLDWVTWSPDGAAIAGLRTPILPRGAISDEALITVIPLDH